MPLISFTRGVRIQNILADLTRSHITDQETHDITISSSIYDTSKVILKQNGCFGGFSCIDGANWRWQYIDSWSLTSSTNLRILCTGTGYTGSEGKLAFQIIEGMRVIKNIREFTINGTGSTSLAIISTDTTLSPTVDLTKTEIVIKNIYNLDTYISAASANCLQNVYLTSNSNLRVDWARSVAQSWSVVVDLIEYY